MTSPLTTQRFTRGFGFNGLFGTKSGREEGFWLKTRSSGGLCEHCSELSSFIREEGFIEYLSGYLLLKDDYALYVTNRLRVPLYIVVCCRNAKGEQVTRKILLRDQEIK
jgi:hypothetical protein